MKIVWLFPILMYRYTYPIGYVRVEDFKVYEKKLNKFLINICNKVLKLI